MKRSATPLRHSRVSELSRRKHKGGFVTRTVEGGSRVREGRGGSRVKETAAARAKAPLPPLPLIQPEVLAEQDGKVTGSAGPTPPPPTPTYTHTHTPGAASLPGQLIQISSLGWKRNQATKKKRYNEIMRLFCIRPF